MNEMNELSKSVSHSYDAVWNREKNPLKRKESSSTPREEFTAPTSKRLRGRKVTKELFPDQIFSRIFRSLHGQDLYHTSIVCKRFHLLIRSDKKFYLSRYLESCKNNYINVNRLLYLFSAMELGPHLIKFGQEIHPESYSGFETFVKKCPNVESLKTDVFPDFYESDFKCLKDLPKLREFYFGDVSVYIEDRVFEHLPKQLEVIDFSHGYPDSVTNNTMKHLSQFEKLKSLNLNNCKNVTWQGLEYLKNLPCLAYLNIGYFKELSERGIFIILKMQALKHLILNSVIQDEEIHKLTQLRPGLKVDRIINENFFEIEAQDPVESPFREEPSLNFPKESTETFSLKGDIQVLPNEIFLKIFQNLKDLDLYHTTFVCKNFHQLINSNKKFILSSYLESCEKSDYVKRLVYLSSGMLLGDSLKKFGLDDIPGRKYSCFETFIKKCPCVESLKIDIIPDISDDDFRYLSLLPNLKEFYLGSDIASRIFNGYLTENAFEYLPTQLEVIDFFVSAGTSTAVTDNTMKHLSQFKDLRRLSLNNCEAVTREGLKHLKDLPCLAQLDLFWPSHDLTLEEVCTICSMKALKHVILCQSDAAVKAVKTIKLRRPDIRVTFDSPSDFDEKLLLDDDQLRKRELGGEMCEFDNWKDTDDESEESSESEDERDIFEFESALKWTFLV